MVLQARSVCRVPLKALFPVLLYLVLQPALLPVDNATKLFAAEPVATAVVSPAAAGAAAPKKAPEPENRQTASQESSDGLLSSTEMMIEKLIMQMDVDMQGLEPARGTKGEGRSIIASLPSIRPIVGKITSAFGMRMHPILKRPIFHAGTDFSAPAGTRVLVTADGVVASSGFDGGYGKKVVVDHGFGYRTVYAHLSKAVVRQGQRVHRGDIIAFSGNTGRSTGPHLHYEVRKDNVVVNPTAFFEEDSSADSFMTLHDKETSGKDDSNS